MQYKAYEYIKNLILNGKFDYDCIYSETKIAKEIGVSRTPIRDALHRLSQEKYVEIIPSKGFCLHQITNEDLIQTFEVRAALETYCTLQITKRYDSIAAKKLFTNLSNLLDVQQEILSKSNSIAEFLNSDKKFHIEIVQFLNNTYFNDLFESNLFQINHIATKSLECEGRMQATFIEHQNIFDAMVEGNISQIQNITLHHIEAPKDFI
ncbi:hypothetical protein AN639_02560 [Candidatus Epulonipiscium fishelsonii]|uniref:Uncharacterized protein n=1 Tax=Candidatus Epulonipiscium fishelsonii TaxID=77094 RepID=A0ACC8XB92_9FIRM|nr:hypothetical protein AN396_07800 [Epulopiscium sp. SCG-B11WGA-EpuloA1]ONI42042.1 hypothetical protein AN639_02560 [Epulopiscium sp. SCG-B05WGA-EpuloA1]